jgi:hypothetical protein
VKKVDAQEASQIVNRLMQNLLQVIPSKGRPGSTARTAIGDVMANSLVWLAADRLGPPLANAFYQVMLAGATLTQMEWIRSELMLEQPRTLGAILVTNCCIDLCLATEGQVIANMTFVSRSDVQAVKQVMNAAFKAPEEVSADDMDSATFQALIALHAAITNHLVATARPLPKLVNYQFYRTYSTLVLSHRLYGDATRADEIREENHIIHPAFCPLEGIALSQ